MKREEIEELRRLRPEHPESVTGYIAKVQLALPRLLAEREELVGAMKLALSESHGIACEANTEWEDAARKALALAES